MTPADKSQTEKAHSPTPWQADDHLGVRYAVEQNGNRAIAKFSDIDGLATVNRDFVVRAVNSHDALVAAAKDALIVLEHHCRRAKEDPEAWPIIRIVKNALALAEKKP